MDIHRIISVAVLILFVCVSGLWAARLIEDAGSAPVPQQATPNQPKAASTVKQPGIQKSKAVTNSSIPGESLAPQEKNSDSRINMSPQGEPSATTAAAKSKAADHKNRSRLRRAVHNHGL